MRTKIIVTLVMLVTAFLLAVRVSMGMPEVEREFTRQREIMVREQIEARGIKDKPVLEVMRRVKRHLFVPPAYRHLAYADMPLPIGEGQTISQPYIVALMTELLALKGNEKVLEIGTGSGYQAAILAELAKEVYTIEILAPLANKAEKLLKELGYSNVYVRHGDGFLGWPEFAPFDAIIVTCAPEEIPAPLIGQLAEGARLVIPVGGFYQELKLVEKKKGKIVTKDIVPVRFVSMLRERPDVKGAEDKELTENLKRHVRVLSQDIGERNFMQYQNLERAADYISEEFKNYGYEPEEQIYSLEGKPYRNIIATKKGEILSDKIIIVCSHYDSVMGSPGADDNASGVSGLLELARALSKENVNQTTRFIAFTNEEPPLFMTKDMGSFRYAQEAKRKGDNILGVVCLESIGYYSDKKGAQSYPLALSPFYPNKGNFIALVSNFHSRRLLKRIVREFKEVSSFSIEYLIAPAILAPAISFSDHWSFWKFGYRAVMITDTAFYRTPYYHTPQDTFEKLNYASMAELVKAFYRVLLELR